MTQISKSPFSDRPEGGAARRTSAQNTSGRPVAWQGRAFTLIELMISIALVVLLILGVSQVFQYTTQAVGAGEAVTAAIRNSRSVQSTLDSDFAAMVGTGTGNNDAASLIISSRAVYAFRDSKDQLSQGTLYTPQSGNIVPYLPSAAFRDLNSDGTFGDPNVNGEIIYPDNYNYRNHRIDTLSFFARNIFSRQTGNLGTIVDPLSSPEAWIWYGHLWLPDNTASYPFTVYPLGGPYPANGTGPVTFPGAGTSSTNPNNFFASQWVLGRQAILLKEKDTTNTIDDSNNTAQRYIDHPAAYVPYSFPVSTVTELPFVGEADTDPLASSSLAATLASDTSPWILQDGRFDLASTSISAYRNKLASYLDTKNTSGALASSSKPLWYDSMMDGSINPNTAVRPFIPAYSTYTRFRCNPFLAKPFTAANLAQASPYFLGGCSQFIVEFAGDFLTQDNNIAHVVTPARSNGTSQYGDVISAGPDGQIDFFINAQGAKQIIWYGMPRNTSGQATTCAGPNSVNNPTNTNYLNPNGDVVPVRDWLQVTCSATGMIAHPLPGAGYESFEKFYPTYQATDYNANMTIGDAQNGYTCAWGPTDVHPKIMLIRITMTLEDPTGRLPEGQTFQYVFPVAPASSSN